MSPPRKPIQHGTWHGYKQELRTYKIPTCDDCRRAWTDYCRERREIREARKQT